MSLTALNGNVVLRPIEEQEEMYGNIVLPDLGKEKPEMAEVVDASATYNWHKGEYVPSQLEVGQRVLIPKMGSVKVTIDGEDYYITKESEILAKL
jgi:chaperonin GroES